MISIIVPAHKDPQKVAELLSVLATLKDIATAEVFIALSPESEADYLGLWS